MPTDTPDAPRQCPYCPELVLPSDHRDPTGTGHHECLLRAILGSVRHLQRKCSCYHPEATETDPPGLTQREAARASLALWRELDAMGILGSDPIPQPLRARVEALGVDADAVCLRRNQCRTR